MTRRPSPPLSDEERRRLRARMELDEATRVAREVSFPPPSDRISTMDLGYYSEATRQLYIERAKRVWEKVEGLEPEEKDDEVSPSNKSSSASPSSPPQQQQQRSDGSAAAASTARPNPSPTMTSPVKLSGKTLMDLELYNELNEMHDDAKLFADRRNSAVAEAERAWLSFASPAAAMAAAAERAYPGELY